MEKITYKFKEKIFADIDMLSEIIAHEYPTNGLYNQIWNAQIIKPEVELLKIKLIGKNKIIDMAHLTNAISSFKKTNTILVQASVFNTHTNSYSEQSCNCTETITLTKSKSNYVNATIMGEINSDQIWIPNFYSAFKLKILKMRAENNNL